MNSTTKEQSILVRAVRQVYPAKRGIIEQRKREAQLIWNHPDFIWEQLLRSFSTMGNSRGARLMSEPKLHDRVTYRVIAALRSDARRTRLRDTLAAAPVRMPERKTDWLCRNFDRIEREGGPGAVKENLCAQQGRDAKIAFLRTFDGIGEKYARNILMDAYHIEFRDSIAYDERLKKIANALGLKFSRYQDAEQFFLDVAAGAGLDGWELDRLLYNATDDILARLGAPVKIDTATVPRPIRRPWDRCRA